MSKLRIFVGVGIGVLVVILVAWQFVLPRLAPVAFYGHVMPGGEPAPAFELEGANGEKVSLTDFEGQVVAIFFGYTYCPDVCPMSLSKLARAMDMLGESADEVQVVMITVDPERDTPEVLEKYVGHFNDSFIGLWGELEEIDRIATQYGVYFEAVETTSAVGYLVNHTAAVMVIDKSGELKLVQLHDLTDKQVAADLANLVG